MDGMPFPFYVAALRVRDRWLRRFGPRLHPTTALTSWDCTSIKDKWYRAGGDRCYAVRTRLGHVPERELRHG